MSEAGSRLPSTEHSAAAARVYLRHVRPEDRREFIDLMQRSRRLHAHWISPPVTANGFMHYLERVQRDDHEGFAIARFQDDAIVGVINLNNIVRGSFLSASLGYYVGAPYSGRGYMMEGLERLKRHATEALGLHRLEANIQPANAASLNLVERCGFQREGLAPGFLFINGRWRDHERWAYVHPRQGMRPGDDTP